MSYAASTMSADTLETLGASASADMVLTPNVGNFRPSIKRVN